MRPSKHCHKGFDKDGNMDSKSIYSDSKLPQGRSKTKSRGNGELRDFFARTNVDLFIIGLLIACHNVHLSNAKSLSNLSGGSRRTIEEKGGEVAILEHLEEEEIEDSYAVLFPWFAEIIGVFVYYVLSRYVKAIPYTAIMFIIGFCIGFSVQRSESNNAITESASLWIGINGEVILLVFLPGLIYLDSFNINVHLFLQSFWQLVIFAFPMVLGGTTLTALVAYYIFPYGWSLDLCMTFGSILAATDPVAVSVLLNELGAPPRLKMHISGESLLNDGSAVVFFNIFSARFFHQLGIDGVGDDIGWGEGFEIFFRLAFGGACIGLAFGMGTVVILYNLSRRLSAEENIAQVVTSISAAYLAFFTSEILAGCSGIIAVLFCGVTIKTFGETLINDTHLTHHFWEITEHLLNTLLFALGGCVWGDIISDSRNLDGIQLSFMGRDWGYLLLLFVLLTVIRFVLIFSFYPITSRIGIGSNWKEAAFMSYGGLRGAVGIALALSLNAEIFHFTSADVVDEETRFHYREFTTKLFGMVGGIAFLTLIVNGTTSGLLLQKLGLVTPSETRLKVIENYRQHMILDVLAAYVGILSQNRFKDVDFSVIKAHVPFLRDITREQFLAAVKKHKDFTPAILYSKPNLEHVFPYLSQLDSKRDRITEEETSPIPDDHARLFLNRRESVRSLKKKGNNLTSLFDSQGKYDENDVHEERQIFIQILRSSYHHQIEHGELESRGFMPHSLFQSLDFAEDAACKGLPLNDWNATQIVSDSWVIPADKALHTLLRLKQGNFKDHSLGFDQDLFIVTTKVRQALAFIHAHERAQKIFKEEFSSIRKDSLTIAEEIVLKESESQIKLADAVLSRFDQHDVQMIKSHYVCQILLNKSACYFEKLAEHGLMTEREAGDFLEEIEREIEHALECHFLVHDDHLSLQLKIERLREEPSSLLDDLNLSAALEKMSTPNTSSTNEQEKPEEPQLNA